LVSVKAAGVTDEYPVTATAVVAVLVTVLVSGAIAVKVADWDKDEAFQELGTVITKVAVPVAPPASDPNVQDKLPLELPQLVPPVQFT
jgi:hypothetical protein